MAKCMICNKNANPGSRFCSDCPRFVTYEHINSRRQAVLRVWYGNMEDTAGFEGRKGFSSRWPPEIRRRPVRKGVMFIWAGMVNRLQLETDDKAFEAVVRRLAER